MRIYGLMVTRNEGGRYFSTALRRHLEFLDDVFIYDDQSTDDTVKIGQALCATVMTRGDQIPSFLEHEGKFRQAGWEAFEEICQPEDGDWVLALDADEFFVSLLGDERATLEQAARSCNGDAINLRIDEIFDVRYGHPYRRVDGYWGQISAPRFVRYRKHGKFWEKEMGGGSVPTYALDSKIDGTRAPFSILHYGYATAEDRAAKYSRYIAKGNHGHNSRHIESILAKPTLEPMGFVL